MGHQLQMPYPLQLEKQDTRPATATDTVQAVCQLWNQSHELTRKFGLGPLQSNYATYISKCTEEGNDNMINTHIITMCSNRTSILCID
jgi:hypothetical protein